MLHAKLNKDISFQVGISQGIDSWIKSREAEVRERSLLRYKDASKHLLNFLKIKYAAIDSFNQFTTKHAHEYKDFRYSEQGAAKETVNFELNALSNLFKYLVDREYIPKNPFSRVSRFSSEDAKDPRCFTKEEYEKLLQAGNDVDRCLLVLLRETGFRRDELRFLTWNDVDFDKGLINVVEKPGFQPKTKQSKRSVPITEAMFEVLNSIQKNPGFIFKTRTGKQWGRNEMWRRIQKLCVKANILRGGVHALRHSWNSQSAEAGVPKEVRKKLGGWKTDEMVNRYEHPTEKYVKDVYLEKFQSIKPVLNGSVKGTK